MALSNPSEQVPGQYINMIIHHVTQTASIALAFVWFGWQGGIIVFFINWASNTEKYT